MSFNIDTSNVSLDNLIFTLQKAQEAEALLEKILSHYNFDTMDFQFQSDADFKKSLKKLSPENQKRAMTQKERLYEAIKNYIAIPD